jgi:hypothetical protein
MYQWIRQVVSSKLVQLEKIHTDKNGSDMMTKILPREMLLVCCKAAGMVMPPTEVRWGRMLGILLIWVVRRWPNEAFTASQTGEEPANL